MVLISANVFLHAVVIRRPLPPDSRLPQNSIRYHAIYFVISLSFPSFKLYPQKSSAELINDCRPLRSSTADSLLSSDASSIPSGDSAAARVLRSVNGTAPRSHRNSRHVKPIDFGSEIVALHVDGEDENRGLGGCSGAANCGQPTLVRNDSDVFIINSIINQINPIDYWRWWVRSAAESIAPFDVVDGGGDGVGGIEEVHARQHLAVRHFSRCQRRIKCFDHHNDTGYGLTAAFRPKSIEIIDAIGAQSATLFRQIGIQTHSRRLNTFIFDRIICDSFSMMQFKQNVNLISEFNQIASLFLLNNRHLFVLMCDDKKRCRGKRKHRWKVDGNERQRKLPRKNHRIKSNTENVVFPIDNRCRSVVFTARAVESSGRSGGSGRPANANVPKSETIRAKSSWIDAVSPSSTNGNVHLIRDALALPPAQSQSTPAVLNGAEAVLSPAADRTAGAATAPTTIASNGTALSHINRRITHVSVPNFNHCPNTNCSRAVIAAHRRHRARGGCRAATEAAAHLKRHLYLLLMALMVCGPFISAAAAVHNMKYSPNVVKTKYGQLRGIVVRSNPTVEAYLGVPYATPPVGSLR